jgi:acyl-coenzyme A thioesterase PaaI-like protein
MHDLSSRPATVGDVSDVTSTTPTDHDLAIKAARRRAGRAIRDLNHAFIGRHATLDQLERLTDVIEGISAELWPLDQRTRGDRSFTDHGFEDYPQGRFHHDFDDRPISGASSPYGLDLEMHRHGDEIEALVTLRSAHEGAPNRSHGGFVAALFDDVFGFVLGVLHEAAFTGDLYIRYQAPTPLFRQLACRVRLADREGRKIFLSGELTDVEAGTTVATAKATFIAVDRAIFASQTAARPAPPDEDA